MCSVRDTRGSRDPPRGRRPRRRTTGSPRMRRLGVLPARPVRERSTAKVQVWAQASETRVEDSPDGIDAHLEAERRRRDDGARREIAERGARSRMTTPAAGFCSWSEVRARALPSFPMVKAYVAVRSIERRSVPARHGVAEDVFVTIGAGPPTAIAIRSCRVSRRPSRRGEPPERPSRAWRARGRGASWASRSAPRPGAVRSPTRHRPGRPRSKPKRHRERARASAARIANGPADPERLRRRSCRHCPRPDRRARTDSDRVLRPADAVTLSESRKGSPGRPR